VPLGSLIRPELIFPDLPASDRQEVLRALAGRVTERGLVKSAGELFQRLLDRELLGSTGIGGGIAIPHCKLGGLKHGIVAVGIVPAGVDFGGAQVVVADDAGDLHAGSDRRKDGAAVSDRLPSPRRW